MATADVSYVPGALTAVAGDQCWALVEVSPDSPAVGRIWQQLGQGVAADALLAALIANGMGDTPGFTLLMAGPGGHHRLFCRGTVGATVVTRSAGGSVPQGQGQAAAERIDGAGLLTWREQVVGDAERIFLGEPPADTAMRLPATSGVLLAGCMVVDLASPAARDTAYYPPGEYQQAEYQPGPYQAAPPAAPSWPPGPDDAWADGARAPVTAPVPTPVPLPAPPPAPPGVGLPANGASPSPADGLSGVPQWLSNPSGPVPTGSVPTGVTPPGPVPDGTPPASTGSASTAPAGGGPPGAAPVGTAPSGPGPAEPPNQPPAPHVMPDPGEPGSAVQPGEWHEPVARTTPPDRIGPVVPALLCPNGHVNPPSGSACRRCGAPLPHDPVPVPRPVLGVLRLSLGDVITLDRGVLMGRNPRTDFAGADGFGGSAGGERPHVVKLPTGDGDISRTHLWVTLDGWHVLVTDLNSTNGTLVTLPGGETLQLRPGEPLPIQSGTVVTLADGIDFRYEASE